MHSDQAEIQKSVRKYFMIGGLLLVFTVITVTASYFNLAVPAAVTLALIIATMKGSMVAAIFMHLSHERRWIYGVLILTVVFFVVLMVLPIAFISDNIGTPTHAVAAGEPHGR